jgi:glycine hydroxymethyltransferase
VLVDLTEKGISGKAAERALEAAGITVNKNMVPFDERSPLITSGVRIGTPALSSRGMKQDAMRQIAGFIDRVIQDPKSEENLAAVRAEARELAAGYPLYPEA